MRRMLRGAIGAASAALVAAVTAAALVYGVSEWRLHADLSTLAAVRPIAPATGEDAVTRGQHAFEVLHGCSHCHGEDGGGSLIVDSAVIGHVEGANVTRGGALADYDLGTFGRLVRNGLRRDGTPLVFMPSDGYTRVSDQEIGELWAYLQALPPSAQRRPRPTPGPLARALFLAGQMPILGSAYVIDHDLVPPAAPPPTTDLVAYGAHIGAGCSGCHGENLGGGPVAGAPPDWPAAPNISRSPEGIGAWSEEDFVQTLKTLKNPKGVQLREPMASSALARYTPDEFHALWAFLRSKPGVPDNPGAGRLDH
jgi:mono/diheme cytochrome c family protein